ncbi:MAG: outer membrane beta-barrel protein [Treponema succinifaciens]|uniref:outer membrane beta-barrel protein n=1 Tax=Treponema succinifaciens TaxID=167 RepID=UPI002A751E31|nr:outer membrane beta-barrel protein [Treponema succinifaciens]MDY2616791.1 outer membrane beta-barrel protein [Treponema succinifaciens]
MKKLLVAGFCLLGALCFMQAQNVDWKNYGAGIEEGDFIVRGDIGFSRHWKSLPYDGSMKVPYLEASVEYTKKLGELPLGFGGFIGYSQDKMKETASFGVEDVPDYEWKGEMNYINLGALANYHIQVPVEKLDLYAGLRLGLEFWNWKVDYKYPSYEPVYGSYGYLVSYKYKTEKESIKKNGTNFYAGINFGASYFFTEKFGANIEVGYPQLIKIGGTAKF